jgi:murein DD-endopeptidase MepM/ murein hydrolase activator NlpD
MNKKEGLPLIKKVLICLMTMVMVIISAAMPVMAAQINVRQTPVQWSVTPVAAQVDNLFTSTIDDYINELEEQGYEVISKELDIEAVRHQINVQSAYISKEASSTFEKNFVKNIIKVKISATQITIGTEIFYFKNSTDALTFVNELNEQIKTEYSIIENVEIDKNDLTEQSTLDKKIEDAKTEKQKIEQRQRELEEEQKRKQQQITSRSGTTRSSNSVKAPLASYVYISSSYGMRNGKMHTGTDFAASAGTAIYAWKSGKVTYCGWNGSYGNFVEIDHGDGTVSRYAHMSGFNCSLGDTVSAGYTIGYVGSTGNSTGPHLHFEIKINGNFVNSINYL